MIDYDKIISEKCKEIKPSGIRKFFDLASSVGDVISLSVGEPDFPTPWTVRRTAIQTLEKKRIVYTANSGMPELKRAISEYIDRHINVKYDPADEITVTVGGSEAIDIAIRALVNPGDEVLIPEPCFVSYLPITQLTGGIPVRIETRVEDEFRLTAEALKEKITHKTKLLILPYPNNPTGAIMTARDLEAIAGVLRNTGIMVLSDEIYSELTYDGKHVSIAELDGMRERVFLVNGFSKAFAMTGWRLGYLAGPAELISQAQKIHQFAIMCSPTISQYAAVEALDSCGAEVDRMVKEYDLRRRWLVSAFNEAGLECFEPKGAFYVFPSIKRTGLSSEEFCERLLNSKKVAVVPGNAFGESGEGFIRVSYAYSLKHLMEAMERIKEFLNR